MNRLVYLLLTLPLFLSFLNTVHAGPACARRNRDTDSCIQLCRQKWGWPGHTMGTNRWGSVVSSSKSDIMDDIASQACGDEKPSTSANINNSMTQSPSSVQRTGPSVPINVASTLSASTSSVSTIPSVSPSSFSIKVLSSTSASSSPSGKPAGPNALVSSSTSTRKTTSSTSTRTSSTSTRSTPSSTRSTPSSTRSTPSSTRSTSSTTKSTTTTSKTTSKTTTISTSTTTKTTPTSTTTKITSSSSSTSSTPSPSPTGGSTSQSEIDAYLQSHNSIRSQHGAAPLTWNDDLAAAAQKWANNCVFKHSGGTLGKFGENLAAGTSSTYGISQAVKSWTDEVSEYDPNNPVPSHFTQVVWKGTTQVGCALQICDGIFDPKFGRAKYFVCEYSPQGNIIGRFGENVQV